MDWQSPKSTVRLKNIAREQLNNNTSSTYKDCEYFFGKSTQQKGVDVIYRRTPRTDGGFIVMPSSTIV